MDNFILGTLLVLTIIAVLVEGFILLYVFINSDTQECNMFWCTFTTTGEENYTVKTYNENSECYKNDVKVHCSNLPNYVKFEK